MLVESSSMTCPGQNVGVVPLLVLSSSFSLSRGFACSVNLAVSFFASAFHSGCVDQTIGRRFGRNKTEQNKLTEGRRGRRPVLSSLPFWNGGRSNFLVDSYFAPVGW